MILRLDSHWCCCACDAIVKSWTGYKLLNYMVEHGKLPVVEVKKKEEGKQKKGSNTQTKGDKRGKAKNDIKIELSIMKNNICFQVPQRKLLMARRIANIIYLISAASLHR